jgi:hypothetical protein
MKVSPGMPGTWLVSVSTVSASIPRRVACHGGRRIEVGPAELPDHADPTGGGKSGEHDEKHRQHPMRMLPL